jgi:hypothetical protein
MKTNVRSTCFVSLAIAVAAALVTQPMRATAINTLVITENSSTSLTALLTVNGTTTSLGVSNSAADTWFVALVGFNGQQGWLEPGASSSDNFVQGQPTVNRISIISDGVAIVGELADGTPDTTDFTLNGNPLSVTFFDKGDVATAPDTGSTLGLLVLALTALLGTSRLRSFQLA